MKAILTYHSIDPSGSPISLAPEAFAAHARWLASGRVRVLSLDDLGAHPEGGGDAVAVTFDDGFLNTRERVEELLAAGVPTTVFVVSGHVGTTNAWGGRAQTGVPTLPLLGWRDLERLVDRGAAVAPHTRTHRSLTKIGRQAVNDELQGSLEDLATHLGMRSGHLAYPYGDVDAAVAEQAARYFRCGYTTDFRVVDAHDASSQLPRLDMYYFSAPGALERWGTRRFARRLAWIRARRALRALAVGSLAS